jgi:pimeloyl-ACP methyl ester carboxylesterase
MADDLDALLEGIDVESAHIVGASMGGMIAQTLAIRHPSRVRSLCSIMSTTGSADVSRPTPEAMAVLMQPPPVGREAYIATELANTRVIGSRRELVDEDWRRARFERFYDRGVDPAGTARQIMAIVASGDRTAALAGVTAPTVVIHGDVDPLVRLDSGEATTRAIPGAVLLVIADMGHEIAPATWPRLVSAIVANARRKGPVQ